jgi:acetylornithine deacetylase/succinyl-diaminopimelate desuccinylase-like protein
LKKRDPLLGSATLSITRIEGGIGLNVVPPDCKISLDRRLLPSEALADAQEQVNEVLRRLETEDPSLEAETKLFSAAEAAATPEEAPIVQAALRSRTEVLGAPSEPGGFTACCDMWHLKNQGGIPTVILGPGKLNMAHKRDETIEISQLTLAVEIYRNLALRWLGSLE